MKVAAVIGLVFLLYCLAQVLRTWASRSRTSKAIWFVVIATGAGWCLGALAS